MHCYYWETTDEEPTKHCLSVSWVEKQYNLVLTSDDSREDVIKKLLEYAIEVEDV